MRSRFPDRATAEQETKTNSTICASGRQAFQRNGPTRTLLGSAARCRLPAKVYELPAKMASYATPVLGSQSDPRIGVSWEAGNWIPACRKQEICKKGPRRRPHFWGHEMTPKLGSRSLHFDSPGPVLAGGLANHCPDLGKLRFGDMSDQVAESGSGHLRPKPLQRVGPSTRSFIFSRRGRVSSFMPRHAHVN